MKTSSSLASRKIDVLFLGGSNTMMKGGYADETLRALGEFYELGRVDNLAAGGTSVGMGLWTTLNLGKPKYDLVFLCYSISDYTSVKQPARIATWRWAFEGLLRNLRAHNPRARIYTLMFGRRGKHQCEIRKTLFQLTREIAAGYDVEPIDVDGYLHGLLGADADNDRDLYEDDSHYARPVASALAGNYVARVVIATEHRRDSAPPAEAAKKMTPPKVGHADHSIFSPIGEALHFKNSRYARDAVALRVDGPWQDITVPGSLMQLNYISTINSTRILVAEEGETPFTFDTLHKRTDSGEFAFLMRNLLLSWKKPPKGRARPRKLSLRAIATPETSVDGQDFKFVKVWHMLPPKTPERNNVVLLTGALYA